MSRSPERRNGGRARYALPLTVLLMMSGVVIAANPGHYGLFGIAIGVGMVVLGGVLTMRLFRTSEAEADDTEPGDDRPVDTQ